MGETINEIERDLAAERMDLRRNLNELETKARQMTDWRRYYRNHPGQLIGAALATGVVLGIVAGGRSTTSRDQFVEDESAADLSAPRSRSRAMNRLHDDWQHISDALLGVASAKVMEFVGNLVPGFHDQLRREHPDSTSSV
jgi:hypothetical protein